MCISVCAFMLESFVSLSLSSHALFVSLCFVLGAFWLNASVFWCVFFYRRSKAWWRLWTPPERFEILSKILIFSGKIHEYSSFGLLIWLCNQYACISSMSVIILKVLWSCKLNKAWSGYYFRWHLFLLIHSMCRPMNSWEATMNLWRKILTKCLLGSRWDLDFVELLLSPSCCPSTTIGLLLGIIPLHIFPNPVCKSCGILTYLDPIHNKMVHTCWWNIFIVTNPGHCCCEQVLWPSWHVHVCPYRYDLILITYEIPCSPKTEMVWN